MNGHVAGGRDHFRNVRWQVGTQVRFGEQHDRSRAALPSHQEISLQPTNAEVVVQAHDDEDDVHVGGDDLLIGDVAGHTPRETAPTWQDGNDSAAVLVGTLAHDHPVTYGGQLALTFS